MNVTVYSTPTCPWCARAKEYLRQNRIDFRDVNVAVDRAGAMEMIMKSGQSGVPVIDINGRVIIGFDQQSIDNALGL